MRRLAVAFGLSVLATCGNSVPAGAPAGEATPYPTPTAPRYQATAIVVESPTHGPALCLGVVLISLPPRCGHVPVAGWDWDRVEGEKRAAGTIWGEYQVVGMYDGNTFTLTQDPDRPEREDEDLVRFETACPEPTGGWPHAADVTDQDIQRVATEVAEERDYAGLWLTYEGVGRPEYGDPRRAGGDDPMTAIINVVFTGDLERHEAAIREIWKGGLCVIKRSQTLAQLQRIAGAAMGFATKIGRTAYMSDVDELKGIVVIGLHFADANDQKRFDERFGEGVVKLESVIRPL